MKTVKLKDVAISCDSGTWGDEVSENIVGNPVLRSSNITDFKLKLADFAWRQIPEKDIERKKLQNGDIIITASSGSSHLIGKCAYFTQPKDKYDYYFSNFTLRLRGDSEKINPKFLFYWLISNQARSYLQGADNTTSGLRNLNKTIYLDQPVPLPPLPEQKRIAEVLDKADALREKRRLALQKLDTLLQSVFLEM
ncbi:MAG: restriction endonuclease subunit S, partial [Aridibacter sp.]